MAVPYCRAINVKLSLCKRFRKLVLPRHCVILRISFFRLQSADCHGVFFLLTDISTKPGTSQIAQISPVFRA